MKEKNTKSNTTQQNNKVAEIIAPTLGDIILRVKSSDWIKCFFNNDLANNSERDALKVLNYLIEELAVHNIYKNNSATSKLDLRVAVYFLSQGGYKLLGHPSLKACLEAELPNTKSISTLYRESDAANIEAILLGKDKIGTIRESVLRPFGRLRGDETLIRQAWKEALRIKTGTSEFPTAKVTKEVVSQLLGPKTDKKKPRWREDVVADIAKKVASIMEKEIGKTDEYLTIPLIREIFDLSEKQLLDSPKLFSAIVTKFDRQGGSVTQEYLKPAKSA